MKKYIIIIFTLSLIIIGCQKSNKEQHDDFQIYKSLPTTFLGNVFRSVDLKGNVKIFRPVLNSVIRYLSTNNPEWG